MSERRKGVWSKEEELYLFDHWEDTSEEIGRKLNRSSASVRGKKCKIRRNGIRREGDSMYMKVYSPEEIRDAIKKLHITQEYLGVLMGVSASSISMMINRRRNTEVSTRLLATIILQDLEHDIIDWRKVN